MTRIFLILSVILGMISCNTKTDKAPLKESLKNEVAKEDVSFFPVTNYIKGQIAEIKKRGINPLLLLNKTGKTDSVWLKTSEFDSAFNDFLFPVIDSANLIPFYSESKFADQTINSYTFTYAPINDLPVGMTLQRWDVYINPTNNNVRKIFMVKRISPTSEMQLTWQSDKWCKSILIETDASGEQLISREQIITWNFD